MKAIEALIMLGMTSISCIELEPTPVVQDFGDPFPNLEVDLRQYLGDV